MTIPVNPIFSLWIRIFPFLCATIFGLSCTGIGDGIAVPPPKKVQEAFDQTEHPVFMKTLIVLPYREAVVRDWYPKQLSPHQLSITDEYWMFRSLVNSLKESTYFYQVLDPETEQEALSLEGDFYVRVIFETIELNIEEGKRGNSQIKIRMIFCVANVSFFDKVYILQNEENVKRFATYHNVKYLTKKWIGYLYRDFEDNASSFR